ncbi:lipase family protein [Gordonia sp. ABSL49_1]|uniref:lipase family protein n=1 Tax=Gordonia sp. ABSL49_1 TaxID=2920941 RepID=UPI001F0E6312|nr:lipase family protein [Gordonia sp. ABSL49_1]MCH5641129.1 lipase family protein [Gordonia sp. ABSL49_1]
MTITNAIGPGFDVTRPTRPVSGTGEDSGLNARFPVYPNLVGDLLNSDGPSVAARQLSSVASGYVYSDVATQATMMTRMGLEKSRCVAVQMSVDAMFIRSTAHVIQSEDGRVVIVAYRGTEPTNVISWLADADLYPDRIPFLAAQGLSVEQTRDDERLVHGGFYRNFRATKLAIIEQLYKARNGHLLGPAADCCEQCVDAEATNSPQGRLGQPLPGPIQPAESVFLTGHSFGGAQATLMATALRFDPVYSEAFEGISRATYTFGQPMVGTPQFADFCADDEALQQNTYRFIYQRDPVPHLPPTATGRFKHFGQEFRYERAPWECEPRWHGPQGRPTGQDSGLLGLVGMPLAFVTRQIPVLRAIPFEYSIDDHFPHHYVSAATPLDRPNEYGDHLVVAPKSKGFGPFRW